MAAMAAVLLGWSLLTTVCFARCVELMAIARLVTLTLVESGLDLAPHLIFSSCLAALGALLLFLPFRGSRSHGLRGAAVGTLAGVGVIFFLCDGPLLYRPPNGPVLAGQTILITGANSGIGFAVGIAAAERGAHVLLACRSEAPCAAAAASMRSAAGGAGGTATPVPAPLDLSDLHTVRGFAAAVKKLSRHLDVLVLNAGFAAGQGDGRPAVTAQGIELSFGAMHVGHALLTDLLLPLLESSKHGSRPTLDFPARGGGPKMEFPARLVTVSSEAAALARPFHPSLYHGFGEGDLRGEITNVGTPLETPSRVANLLFYTMPSYLSRIGFSSFSATYIRAKYANTLFARAMSERPPRRHSRPLISTAVAPGFVATPIFAGSGLHSFGLLATATLSSLAVRSPATGALPVLRAIFDAPDTVGGAYLDSMALPRSFEKACWAAGGCGAEAQRLMTVTKWLIKASDYSRHEAGKAGKPAGKPAAAAWREATASGGEKQRAIPEGGLGARAGDLGERAASRWGLGAPVGGLRAGEGAPPQVLGLGGWPPPVFGLGASTGAAALSTVLFLGCLLFPCALLFRACQVRLRRGPTPPEEFCNWLLHRPLIAAAADTLFWSVVPILAAAAAAPLVLLVGVGRTAAELARAVGLIRTEAPVEERAKMAVVVTGCDSGFGRAIALALSKQGYTVFAGCLNPAARGPLQAEAAAAAGKPDTTPGAPLQVEGRSGADGSQQSTATPIEPNFTAKAKTTSAESNRTAARGGEAPPRGDMKDLTYPVYDPLARPGVGWDPRAHAETNLPTATSAAGEGALHAEARMPPEAHPAAATTGASNLAGWVAKKTPIAGKGEFKPLAAERGGATPMEQGSTASARVEAPTAATGEFKPLVLDVTRDVDVAEAAERVRQWLSSSPDRILLSVINNAGIGSGGMVDWLSISDFERDAAVNYFGTVRVSKAFLPLQKQAALKRERKGPRPRIIVVCSASGKVSVPLLSSYAASKHAVACFAACLRMEIAPLWGIDVCTVFPSFHKTPLLEAGAGTIGRTWGASSEEIQRDYGVGFGDAAKAVATRLMSIMAWDPALVVEGVVRAATQMHHPPAELYIGADARYGLLPMIHLPAWILEKCLILTGIAMLPKPAGRG